MPVRCRDGWRAPRAGPAIGCNPALRLCARDRAMMPWKYAPFVSLLDLRAESLRRRGSFGVERPLILRLLDGDHDGFGGGRVAGVRDLPRGHERVRLGEVGAGAALRDVIGDRGEPARRAGLALEVAGHVDHVAVAQPQAGNVRRVHEDDAPRAGKPAIPILETVDGRVVLIVAAHGHEEELARFELAPDERVDREARLAVRGREAAFARAVRQVEAARLADPLVVILGAGDDARDEVADAVVVLHEPGPRDARARPERRLGEPRHDDGLAEQLLAGGTQAPARRLDHAHRVLGRDELLSGDLHVALGTPEAGQDQGGRAGDEMGAVQLGRDVGREPGAPERRGRVLGIRSRGEEVPAQREEDLRAAVVQRVDGVDRIEPVLAGRVDAGRLLQRVEEGGLRLLPDSHRPVALDVAVAADGADAGTGLSDRSPQEQDVDYLTDVVDRVLVLGEPHRPANDDPFALDEV